MGVMGKLGEALGLKRKREPLPGPQQGPVAEHHVAVKREDTLTTEREIKEAKVLELERLAQLRREGIITSAEYDAARSRLESAATLKWEYRFTTIPLNVSIEALGSEAAGYKRADEIIETALKRMLKEGWQPDDLTDTYSLRMYDRIETSNLGYTLDSVDIKLKRLV